MPNKMILKKSTVILVLIISSALAWGDDKKTNEPPPVKHAPAGKPAPPAPEKKVERKAEQPRHEQLANPGGKPAGVANPTPRTEVVNPNRRTEVVNPTPRTEVVNPNRRTEVVNPNPRTEVVNPNRHTEVVNPNPRTEVVNSNRRTEVVNPNRRTEVVNPNRRTEVVNPNRRTEVVNPNPRTEVIRPEAHPGGPMGNPKPTHEVMTRGGGRMEVDPGNKPIHYVGSDGQEARFGSKGQIKEVHDPKRNLTIEHGLRRGDTRIITERNGRRLVAEGPNRGFIERPYLNRNGRIYSQRTYWVNGHAYARVYREHFYRGVRYYRYVPVYYYHPAFYIWAFNPWPRPIYYQWGWGPAPWFYGGYFAPAPVYLSASLWLTDFLLAENLRQAYEARQEAEARAEADRTYQPPPDNEIQNPNASAMSPEVKQMIDAEVKRQLAEEQATAQYPPANPPTAPVGDQTPPAALDPKQRLFVVSSNLGVATAEGQECELTPGDVITRIDDTPGDDNRVRVSVMSSKQSDCSIGAMPRVAVDDLQEMHNTFREQLDTGLKTLADNSGKSGLPPAPDIQSTPGEVPPPVPDANVDVQLANQQRVASQAEAQVQQEVQAGPPSQ